MKETGQPERPEFIKHYSEIQRDHQAFHYPGSLETHCASASFGKVFNFQKLGIHHELLKPGHRSSWPHAEQDEEEFIFVIEGTPDVWLNGYLHRLRPGDGVGFPCGTGISHTFINNTASDVRLLVVGEKSKKGSLIYYPLHPIRREQCKDSWWHDVPKHNLGPHDGLPDRMRTIAQELHPPNYCGEIIVESLANPDVLQKLEPFRIKTRQARSPDDGKSWTVHRYCVDGRTLLEVIPMVEEALKEGAWYVHFFSDVGNKLYVVFRGRAFMLPKKRDDSWDDMIKFGESIGVGRRWTESIPVSFKE